MKKSGVNVGFNGEQYWVTETKVKRNDDGTCTASATIRGKLISIDYTGFVIDEPTKTVTEGKPWLRQVRRDLCAEFVRKYGEKAYICNGSSKRNEKFSFVVDHEFLNRIEGVNLGLSVRFGKCGSFQIVTSDLVVVHGRVNVTRQVDIIKAIRNKIDSIIQIRDERKTIEDFFAEFSIA